MKFRCFFARLGLYEKCHAVGKEIPSFLSLGELVFLHREKMKKIGQKRDYFYIKISLSKCEGNSEDIERVCKIRNKPNCENVQLLLVLRMIFQ